MRQTQFVAGQTVNVVAGQQGYAIENHPTERSQHDQTNTIQRNWTGYVVAGQQSAAETSRNGNQKEAINW